MKKRDQELYEQLIRHASGEWLDEMAETCPPDQELKKRYTFTAEFEDWAGALVRREDKRARRQIMLRRAKRAGVRAGIAACILIAVLSLAAFTIPPLRIAITNLLVVQNDGHYGIKPQTNSGQGGVSNDVSAVLAYVPDGFVAVNVHEDDNSLIIVLENMSHETIWFERHIGGGGLTLDSENAEFAPVEVNGLTGFISVKNDERILILNDEHCSFVLKSTIDKESLIKMAENIKR